VEECLRWLGILLFWGWGLWLLSGVRHGVVAGWRGDWGGGLFWGVIPTLLAAPFLAAGYVCYRRRYRSLIAIVGVVGCIVVYIGVMAMPEQLGLFEFADLDGHDSPWAVGLGFAAFGFFLLGPAYAATWFCRLFFWLARGGKRVPCQSELQKDCEPSGDSSQGVGQ
jgi:hypothetical protein